MTKHEAIAVLVERLHFVVSYQYGRIPDAAVNGCWFDGLDAIAELLKLPTELQTIEGRQTRSFEVPSCH